MNIGYACLVVGLRDADFYGIQLKSLTNEKLMVIIKKNLEVLNRIIDYNVKNNIKLFRITSDLIPFGSSTVNNLEWWNLFKEEFTTIGQKIKFNGMRVSMHPGQYTVINSPKPEVVGRSISDLKYHATVLECLGLDKSHKIILHIGGVYGNKQEAIERFKKTFISIDDKIKKRIVIENDDKLYNIKEVLEIGRCLNIPVVFDNLHHELLPTTENKDQREWLNECRSTWKNDDGTPKIHYSQQDTTKRPGAHSSTIDVKQFLNFLDNVNIDTDIMLEVKDKNLSAIKCINVVNSNSTVDNLVKDWEKYKYKVLECDPVNYEKINILLEDQNQCHAVLFYQLIDEAIAKPVEMNNSIKCVHFLWQYLENLVTKKENDKFIKMLNNIIDGKAPINRLKTYLRQLVNQYNCHKLIESYYFTL